MLTRRHDVLGVGLLVMFFAGCGSTGTSSPFGAEDVGETTRELNQ